MSLLSAVRVALGAVSAHRLRFALTSLGIVVGIGAVIAMVSAGHGARLKLDGRLDSVGKNLILVRPGARTESGTVADFAPLKLEDADAIRRELGPLLEGVSPSQVAVRVTSTAAHHCTTSVVGTSPDFRSVCGWQLVSGQFFGDEEVKKSAPVCVLGQTVRRKLFKENANPVGETVRVDHLQLTVIGVAAEKGRNPIGADQDDQVFVPITTLHRKVAGNDHIAMILASARSADVIDRAKGEIARLMRQRHRLRATAADDFDVSSVREMAAVAQVLTGTMHWVVAVIASFSLVVGGIGIMNIMLVSVTERTREIGIRMAVGATPADVLLQFLLEAVVLALVGGALGITLGIAATVTLARLADWPVFISPALVLLDFVISAGVGVFFGYYPALKASRLEPIEALRYE
jgi:putative ABC transport system permease protein